MAGHTIFNGNISITIMLIIIGSAGFVATIYHVISTCFCNQQNNTTEQAQRRRHVVTAAQTPSTDATTTSMSYLIPSHKFQKKNNDGDGDGTCAVCLGDFEEGEELRTMPECMHSFHVLCIDMWLYSHSSCPICRADASPAVLHRSPELGLHELNTYHSIDMMQIGLVQNALVRR